ncbi:MAG: VRR-NUC domain-containing protein [Gammaproteobacteria bacterium]
MITRRTVVHCTRAIRDLWPTPLAKQWHQQYPGLFDEDDLRLTRTQPKNHFSEWFGAIYLYHRDGSSALVEKYVYKKHPRKIELFKKVIPPDDRAVLAEIQAEFEVQLPDLLVFSADHTSYGFAEVKGPGDRLRPKQTRSHEALRERLGVAVEIIDVRIADPRLPHLALHPSGRSAHDG